MASRPPPAIPPGFEPVQAPSVAPQGGPVFRGTAPLQRPPAQTPVNAARDRYEAALAAERLRAAQAENALHAAQRPSAIRAAEDPAGDAPATMRRDAGFYQRAGRANGMYEIHAVEPRGVVGQTLADAFPRLGNVTASTERQRAEAAQADFIGAVLRYESGAAVPPAEFVMTQQRYFPQPGDAPETIADKARLRRNAIAGLQRSAGQAANGINIDPFERPEQGAAELGMTVLNADQQLMGAPPVNLNAPPAGPPGTPPPVDPNLVQPGEHMAGVGNLPNVPIDGGRNVAGAPGATITAHDRRVTGVVNALVNSRLPVEETVNRINQILEADGRQLLTYGQLQAIQSARRNGARFEFTATPRPRSQAERQSDVIGTVVGGHGQPSEAFTAAALDSASLGIPALLSGDYRNAMGDLREAHPIASTVGSLVGAVAAPGGPRPGMNLVEQSARSGAQGGIYAFNESGGDPENALVGLGIGAAAPGAFRIAGRAARPVTNALFRPAVSDEARAIAQAATDENIRVSRPIVDPTSRDRMAYLESQRGTGNRIRQGLEETRAGIEGRAGELGRNGTTEELGTMGQRIQDAGHRFIARSRDIRDRLYRRASQMAGDTPVYGREAVRVLDEEIANLRANSPATDAEVAFLERQRATMVDDAGNLRPRTVQNLRDLRTGLRGQINESGLTFGQTEGRVLRALDAAKADIERDLGASNPGAVRAYRRADRFNAERAGEIRQVVQKVIGRRDDNLSGEQVMARVRAMAGPRGNSQGLERLWQRLSPDEQLDAAATIAETAGRRSADEPFTPGQFMTWARSLSPSARRTIFGPEGARSIANLNVLSQALKDTTSRLNNSRSGVVRNWGSFLRELRYGGGAGIATGVVGGGSALTTGATGLALAGATAGIGAAARRISARALMSPDMSRWLAGAARARTPAAIRQHIERLAVIERSNPAIAQEITGLRQALLSAVNDNVPLQAAASGNEGQNDQ